MSINDTLRRWVRQEDILNRIGYITIREVYPKHNGAPWSAVRRNRPEMALSTEESNDAVTGPPHRPLSAANNHKGDDPREGFVTGITRAGDIAFSAGIVATDPGANEH